MPAAGGDFVAGTAGAGFRACLTSLERRSGGLAVPREAATALGVGPGDTIRFGRLRPGST